MRRAVRALVVTGVLASPLALAACQKPVPKVTVQTGRYSATITPSTYAFDSAHVRVSRPDLPEVTAKADATVLVDVPEALVGRGWQVTALSLTGTASKVVGSSGTIRGRHSYRVAAQTNNGNPFIVQVAQLSKGKPDGSIWSFLVKVSDAA
jgi:hypothetical protein